MAHPNGCSKWIVCSKWWCTQMDMLKWMVLIQMERSNWYVQLLLCSNMMGLNGLCVQLDGVFKQTFSNEWIICVFKYTVCSNSWCVQTDSVFLWMINSNGCCMQINDVFKMDEVFKRMVRSTLIMCLNSVFKWMMSSDSCYVQINSVHMFKWIECSNWQCMHMNVHNFKHLKSREVIRL